ncbi:MAG: hypothetical protein OFPII_06640 [Osedax symbiont Rs1]|nr:MAG: hypothetical protein OFPII_06640 [Osedax symbiont Rs1]
MRRNIERDFKRYRAKYRKTLRRLNFQKYPKITATSCIPVHQQLYALARQELPNIPEEVCKLWLYDRILNSGWPPSGSEWQGYLFNHSIDYWKKLSWQESSIKISVEQLADKSVELIFNLIDAHVNGVSNLVNIYMPDSKERYDSISLYISEKSEIPGKVILLEGKEGYQLIDGAHRIAATLMHQTRHPNNQLDIKAWIAAET